MEAFDFVNGPYGGAFSPAPPFAYVREDLRGTSPKVFVTDVHGRTWRVKGGLEVRSETFCTRLANAVGYYAEPTYFLAGGHIDRVHDLKRAAGFIQSDGRFTFASFERFEPGLQFLDDEAWSWARNPFDGTPQLSGLKILVMLVSDWDNKDARNSVAGSNLGILEQDTPRGKKWIYFVDDWGQSLGRWGESHSQTSTFDCLSFTEQTQQFVTGIQGGEVQFGYRGQHTREFSRGVRVSDVAWTMKYLGRVTDQQVREGLIASGAFENEVPCLAAALRQRIEQLRRAAAGSSPRL